MKYENTWNGQKFSEFHTLLNLNKTEQILINQQK